MKKLYFSIVFILLTQVSIQAMSRDDQERWQDTLAYELKLQELTTINNIEKRLRNDIAKLQQIPTNSHLTEIEHIKEVLLFIPALRKAVKNNTDDREIRAEAQAIYNDIEYIRNIRQHQQTINTQIQTTTPE